MSLITGMAQFTENLIKCKIPFAVIGGLAVLAYGGERTTFDIDFLIDEKHRIAIKKIAEKLNLNVLNENAEVIQFSGSVQIDVVFARRPHSQSMLGRLKTIKGLPYPVVSPEDLIGLKIQGFVGDRSREFRDKGDILTIMQEVSDLDFKKIQEYAEIFNVWEEIKSLKNRS
jgi:hypothetical protein